MSRDTRTCAYCSTSLRDLPMRRRQYRFCSRNCVMAYQRTQQTRERRSQIGREARAKQDRDVLERLLARVKCISVSEDGRIIAAWRIGKQSAGSARYRARKAEAA